MKPLNPMLGETFQREFSDGTQIFLEHSSHVACVSNDYINDIDNLNKFNGFYDI